MKRPAAHMDTPKLEKKPASKQAMKKLPLKKAKGKQPAKTAAAKNLLAKKGQKAWWSGLGGSKERVLKLRYEQDSAKA